MQWDTSLRRLVRAVAVAVLVVTMVGVQPAAADDHLLTDDILGPLGTSVDEVAALEPNPSWAGLGLFSDDALRVLEVAQNEVAAVPYAFGDDPSTPPVITPSGSQVTDFGVTMVHVPAEWVPPASGIADGVAFASTPTYAPGSDMLLMWTRFDSAVDFDQGLTFNEGVTLAIPGLPVWQSTFAGDTWEGANLIPQAVIQDGVIDFGVNRFTPPQSFGDAGVPAFYYRSGDIMAVALDLVSIEGLVEEGRTVDAAAASEGVPQTLLYTGESSDVAAHQAEDFVTELLFGFHLHTAEGAIFVPGFVLRLIAAAWAVFTFVLAPGSVLELVTTPPEPEPEPEPEAATEEEAAEPEPAQPEPEPEEPAAEEVDPPLVDPEPADEGSGFPWVLVVVALVVVFVGCGYALLRAREKEEEEADDEDPRDVPAPTVYGEEIDEPTCDYGIWLVQKVADDRGHRAGDGGHTLIKAPEPYARHVGDYYVTVMQILGEGTDTAEPPAPKNDKVTWSLRDRIWQMQSGVSRTIRGDGLSVATTLRVADEKKADLPENDTTYTERKNYDAHTVEGTCVVHDRTVVRIEFVPAEGLTATRHRYFAKAQSSLRLEFDPFCYMHTRGADGFAEKKGLENVTEAFTFAAKELIEASCQSLHDASFDGPVRVDCANAGLSYELHKAKSVWSVAGKPGQVLEFGGPEIEAGVGPFKLGKVGLKLGDDEAHAKKVQVALEDRDDGERSGLLFEGEIESSLSSKAKLVTNAGVHQYIDNRLSMIGDVNHEMLVSAEGVVDGCDISMTLVLGRPRDARRWPKDPHSELGTISPRAVPDGVDGYIASPTGTTDLQHRAWFFPKRSGLGAPAAGSRVPWTKA